MIQHNTIYIPIYKQSLILAYGDSEEYSSFIEKRFGTTDTPHAGTTARTIEITAPNRRDLILWINSNFVKSFDASYNEIIPHEVMHVTGFVLQYVNVKYDVENDEPYAYLIGYLNRQVFQTMEKYLK
jgi:hypothetical protein